MLKSRSRRTIAEECREGCSSEELEEHQENQEEYREETDENNEENFKIEERTRESNLGSGDLP